MTGAGIKTVRRMLEPWSLLPIKATAARQVPTCRTTQTFSLDRWCLPLGMGPYGIPDPRGDWGSWWPRPGGVSVTLRKTVNGKVPCLGAVWCVGNTHWSQGRVILTSLCALLPQHSETNGDHPHPPRGLRIPRSAHGPRRNGNVTLQIVEGSRRTPFCWRTGTADWEREVANRRTQRGSRRTLKRQVPDPRKNLKERRTCGPKPLLPGSPP